MFWCRWSLRPPEHSTKCVVVSDGSGAGPSDSGLGWGWRSSGTIPLSYEPWRRHLDEKFSMVVSRTTIIRMWLGFSGMILHPLRPLRPCKASQCKMVSWPRGWLGKSIPDRGWCQIATWTVNTKVRSVHAAVLYVTINMTKRMTWSRASARDTHIYPR
jgi:hypothetical protein